MIPFKAPIADILFSLDTAVASNDIPNWDRDLAEQILEHFSVLAETMIAPLDETGDREGCELRDGSVRMPDGFADAYTTLIDGGWQGLTAPEEFGGMAQSQLVGAAVSEVFSGANHSMQMICNLVPGAISTLLRFGNTDQQQKWIPRLVSGVALSTMCLTEPAAGSDLSRIRTKATKSDNGWRIEGEKIFISGGDQDLSEDILHLVLARTGEQNTGIKGLSLFMCAKSDAGSTIRINRIEEKLGLHASPTCHMFFDKTQAELVGEEGAGLSAMFTLMNHARIDVALQGVAHAARAHSIANEYAKERIQGRQQNGESATLVDHPGVRRLLDEQQCLAIGARAMAHTTLVQLIRSDRPALVEFLTPLCKVFCTEAGIRAADIGIQVLGGYGYLTEYRISQTWRDARITSIYEGANSIHELATVTRGLRLEGGRGANAFEKLIGELTQDPIVCTMLEKWKRVRLHVLDSDNSAELAHDFTQVTCDLFYCAVWARIGTVGADPKLGQLRRTVLKRSLSSVLFAEI